MNYEEYAERMAAQKRNPIARENYEECVEAGYMALADNIDKDTYCRLPNIVIAAISKLARDFEAHKEEARKAEATLREAIERLTERNSAVEGELNKALNERDDHYHTIQECREEIARRDGLIDRLLQAMTADQTRRFMLAQGVTEEA